MNEIGKSAGAAWLMKDPTFDKACVCGTSSRFDYFVTSPVSMPSYFCRSLDPKVPRFCDLIGNSEFLNSVESVSSQVLFDPLVGLLRRNSLVSTTQSK